VIGLQKEKLRLPGDRETERCEHFAVSEAGTPVVLPWTGPVRR
jgi:hypothetical protein